LELYVGHEEVLFLKNGAREVIDLEYRVDGPIRHSLFLIWAKGEGGVSPSRTPIFKKLLGIEKAISGLGPVSEK
jgi:hypothetical protein